MDIKKIFNSFLRIIYRLFAFCLLLSAVLLIGIVFLTVLTNISLDRNLLLLLTVIVLILVSYFWRRKKNFAQQKASASALFFEILKLGFGIAIFSIIALGLTYQMGTSFNLAETEATDETITLVTDTTSTGISKYYLSQQTWRDFSRKKHSMPFQVDYDDVLQAHKNRNTFIVTHKFSWGLFYKYLSDHDAPLVETLALSFYNYQKEKNMSRRDFAELIISSIQDIPYNLILSKECEPTDIKPCYGNIRLGLFAPAEFVSNLKGDCDTRTVLIYTLLSRFNYDVAILNSEKYLHSVIGLNIPSTGKYKALKTKKYYFVETTARGCPIGYLSSDFGNIKYWDFALINKQL